MAIFDHEPIIHKDEQESMHSTAEREPQQQQQSSTPQHHHYYDAPPIDVGTILLVNIFRYAFIFAILLWCSWSLFPAIQDMARIFLFKSQ